MKKCPYCGTENKDDAFRCKNEDCLSILSSNPSGKFISCNGAKRIKETKCTCQACGNTWYYGKKELWDNKADRISNFGKEMSNAGSDMMCCGGCLPAIFIPREQVKQVKDLNKCPKCNSSAIRKEEVTHEV